VPNWRGNLNSDDGNRWDGAAAARAAGALMALAEQCRAVGGVAECNCANKVRTS